MPLTPAQQSLLESWLKKHSKPVDPRRGRGPAGQSTDANPEPIPRMTTQEALLENWLKLHRYPIDLRMGPWPARGIQFEAREPVPLTPTQESAQEDWSKRPVDPRKRTPPGSHQANQNPKWRDDEGFEKRYGDPRYYTRVKGLD
jgi:hypothetical protein